MSITILFLVIFEAESSILVYQQVEQFLIYQCLLMVADILTFLFRSIRSREPNDDYNSATDRDRINTFVSVILYFTQIVFFIYANYLLSTLPNDFHDEFISDKKAEVTEKVEDEIDSEKWLHGALMSVVVVGYIHLFVFAAIIICII